MVAAGMQDEVAAAMVELASIAPKGYLGGIETTVSDVLGRPARCFRDFVAGIVMLSSDNWVAVPLYLELAPPADAAAQVAHLFVFRDTGALSGRGSGRFATDLFTLSVTGGDRAQISLAPPRPDFTRRQSSFAASWPGYGCRPDRNICQRPQRWSPWHWHWPAFGRVMMACHRLFQRWTMLHVG